VKISQALLLAKDRLKTKCIDSFSLDSTILLSFALEKPKEFVLFNPDFIIDDSTRDKFFSLLLRRENNEPISHIIGKREFFGLDFFVNSNVLDPRADSETLIEMVIEFYKNNAGNLEFLEIGSGSGCLTISLLKNLNNCCATAIDISEKALDIAKLNAKNHDIFNKIEFIKSDLFECLNSEKKFDFIISNPPYIPSYQIPKLQNEVRMYDPILALDGGIDGLDFYRNIAENATNFLKKDGKIFLEIGQGQETDVEKIFLDHNFRVIKAKNDLANIQRALCLSQQL